MADTSNALTPEGEPPQGAAHLADIEQDLDKADAALAALDSDDLEGAETLAAELDESRSQLRGDAERSPEVDTAP